MLTRRAPNRSSGLKEEANSTHHLRKHDVEVSAQENDLDERCRCSLAVKLAFLNVVCMWLLMTMAVRICGVLLMSSQKIGRGNC